VSQRLAQDAIETRVPVRHSNDWFSFPLFFHPKTGRPIFPVGGASPDDDGGEGGTGGAGGTGGSGSEGQGGEGGTGSGDAGAGGNKDGDDGKKVVTKEEYDKIMERMQAADRNRAAVEKQLKELQEKDLTEQEKVLKRVPELEATVAELTTENKGLKAKVAFLGLDGFSWHEPDIALGQVDLSEVLKDDGETIDKAKLKKEAERLAKDKPFLVKAVKDDDKGGKGGSNGAGGNGQGSSGSGVGSGTGGAGSNSGLSDEALRKKYPALN